MAEVKVPNFSDKAMLSHIEGVWQSSLQDTLCKFIAIPNQSPSFSKTVLTDGLQDAAVKLVVDWVNEQKVPGLQIRVVSEKDRTPVVFITVDGTDNTNETVLLYGHLDKQPPMTASWSEGLGPHKPVIRDGKLYGRGGADDGYSVFAAVAAIAALKKFGVPHARCVILIEACEESGSLDLPHYVELLSKEIGQPSLVICLDSGCGNYEQLWLTTSLRGIGIGTLKVQVLTEAVHSGNASGAVPSSFRIARQLLDRIEDKDTGKMIPEMYCKIPEDHLRYARETAQTLGKDVAPFPFVQGAKPPSDDLTEVWLNKTWRPTLSVTGVDGMPSLAEAGNVLRPFTSLKLSLRFPPLVNAEAAHEAIKQTLERNPPYGAAVTYNAGRSAKGWMAPLLKPWLAKSLEDASLAYFNKPARFMGEGGSIPFMCMLGERFPNTQFVITGLLGPGSNAHGPNEFLHIDMCKKLICCVGAILRDHYVATVATPAAAAKK